MNIQQRQRGQSIVETAMVLPLLVLLIFSIIDFSYYIFSYSIIERSARVGAETASKMPPSLGAVAAQNSGGTQDGCISGVQASVIAAVLWLPIDDIQVRYPTQADNSQYPASPTKAVGSVIEVEVRSTFNWLTPVGGIFGNRTLNFTSRRTIMNADTNMLPGTGSLGNGPGC